MKTTTPAHTEAWADEQVSRYRNMHRVVHLGDPYIPKGCDAQGRRPDRAYQPEAAHAASEIDDDDQSEGATADDMTNIVIIPVAITLAMVSLAALVAHLMAGPL